MSERFLRGLTLAALLTGCTGELFTPAGPEGGVNVGPATGEEGSPSPTSFTCNADAEGVAVPLRRLSKLHFRNSVHDLMVATLPSEGELVWAEVAAAFDNVPGDATDEHKPFSGMDQNVSQQHVAAYFRAAGAAAGALTATSERLSAVLACGEGTSDEACVDTFVQRFARRAFRREPSAAELAFLKEVYAAEGIDAAGLTDVITVVLNAPEFLYHIEGSGDAVSGKSETYALDDYELASRLAYQFWQTTPDDELLGMAQRGELSTEEGFEAALDHVLADSRSGQTLALFAREWLDVDTLPNLALLRNDKLFQAFVEEDMPSPGLRDDMIQEVLDSFTYHVEKGDSFQQWFQSPYSFAQSQELASLYGVPAWDGSAEPPKFSEKERAGLITRAALLATGSANTRPIKKGVFLRERVLCDNIAAPPANVAGAAPELSADLTTREVTEKLTEQKGSSCAACHSTQINGLGFPTENFDALGRVRTEQRLFTEDGEFVKAKSVDTTSVPRVVPSDDSKVSNAQELSDKMLETGKAQACFARQFTRFTFARENDLKKDGCVLEAMRKPLVEGKSLKDVMRTLALSTEFRQRYFGENQ